MIAKKFDCQITGKRWLSPSVLEICFQPRRRLSFEAGQFISVVVPPSGDRTSSVKRAYSLASPPESDGTHLLCVKLLSGGAGSEFFRAARPGDSFTAFAPYGHFTLRNEPGRNVCWIATGSGVAPFRSIALSRRFQECPPEQAMLLFGARTEQEILYRGEFESLGIETVHALSQASPSWKGFHGRVTDYLRSLPNHWAWHKTDFHICGNSEMAREVAHILREGHGVPARSIHAELFQSARAKKAA